MVVELANYSAMFQSIWGLGCFVALVVKAIALSVIAVILTCFNWIVVYWILTEDNIYQGRKFLQDIYKRSLHGGNSRDVVQQFKKFTYNFFLATLTTHSGHLSKK